MRDIDVCNRSDSGHVKKQILLVGQFCSQCDGKEIRTSLHKKACCIDGMWMFVSVSTDTLTTCLSCQIFALNIHLGMNRNMFQDSSSGIVCLTHHQRSLAHYMDSCTTLLLHSTSDYNSHHQLHDTRTEHTADCTEHTTYLNHGLPLPLCRVLFRV